MLALPYETAQPLSASENRTTATDARAVGLVVAGDKVLIGMPFAGVQAALEKHEDYHVTKTGPESIFVSRRRGPRDWVPVTSIDGQNGIVSTIVSTYAAERARSGEKVAAGIYRATQELLHEQGSVSCLLTSHNIPAQEMELNSVELRCGRYTLTILRGRADNGDSASVSLTLR